MKPENMSPEDFRMALDALDAVQREQWGRRFYALISWFVWMSVILGFAGVVLLADLVQALRRRE